MSDNKDLKQQQPEKPVEEAKKVDDNEAGEASNSVSEEQPVSGLAALVGDDLQGNCRFFVEVTFLVIFSD